MIKTFVSSRRVNDLAELLEAMPQAAFDSPMRSTVPLLDYWRSPQMRIDTLCSDLALAAPVETELHFEYQVPVRAGRGKPSFTDLMILTANAAVAIEAKFTEARYETVEHWRDPDNRMAVLGGWLSAISTATNTQPSVDEVMGIPYQLVHRTASVCCLARRHRVVVYQVFGGPPAPHYLEDLQRMARICGERIAFNLMHCPFRASAEFDQLRGRWKAGERRMHDAVRKAMLEKPLADYGDPVWTSARRTVST